jgi:DNA transformation protein
MHERLTPKRESGSITHGLCRKEGKATATLTVRDRSIGMNSAAARERALEIAEGLSGMGPVAVSRFFGGAALSVGGVQFGFVSRGTLYLRVDDESRGAFEAHGAAPFTYSGRSKAVKVASYYETPDDIIEDADELNRWATRAYRAACAAKAFSSEVGTGSRQENASRRKAKAFSSEVDTGSRQENASRRKPQT